MGSKVESIPPPVWTPAEMGRKGGTSKSLKKLRAIRKNLRKAWAKQAENGKSPSSPKKCLTKRENYEYD